MFTLSIGPYQLSCAHHELPSIFDAYVRHAALAEQIDLSSSEGILSFIALTRSGDEWPSLVIAQRFQPPTNIDNVGALLVPETNRLFIGAGTRLLCYDTAKPARLWEGSADFGFWSWTHDKTEVFMAAELEFSTFDTTGEMLWTRPVEPPWHFELEPGRVVLDVMDEITHLDRRSGKAM
ncbi:MAG TPA: hypothetical protein P5572_15220 [Phycisphaerae bacterium]|nr:hypothetical protein [Phycisphaerales bacterium]HRX86370.1 hypothetical protein [Phycisphaerae bacterium]